MAKLVYLMLASLDGEPEVVRDFAALWQAADKIAYSRTLERVASDRTRIERSFDPAAVRVMKASSARDIGVAGPQLAAHAMGAGLVDELHLFVFPVVVGSGTPVLRDGVHANLELLDHRRFRSGVVHLHYRVEM